METYFSELNPDRDPLLLKLEEEAEKQNIPIVGPVVGELLFVLARATRAKNILELGTSIGYSTIQLGRACSQAGGRVITLENDADMVERARNNLDQAGLLQTVKIHETDAVKILPELEGPFDFVFIDIEKRAYQEALPLLSRLVPAGGLLLADNTAFEGAKGFNRDIHASSDWRSVQLFSFLPMHSALHDGLCFAVRI